jgi:FixJ family two-component response regulator
MVIALVGLIAVVEDDDSMREAMGRLLKAAGFGCSIFTSAEALLAGGVDDDVACVVSDLKLPGMSGLDLLTALRKRDRGPPFILITAHDAPALREEAKRRGVAAYLAKPFRGTALLEAVRAAIEPVRPS